jgi:hypothetical protein
MKQEILKKLRLLNKNVDDAKKESFKAKWYAEGYLDCLDDILKGENSELLKVFETKFSSKAKEEAFEDIESLLTSLSRYIDGLDEKKQASEDVDYSIHPNDRAQKFLERIKEVGK